MQWEELDTSTCVACIDLNHLHAVWTGSWIIGPVRQVQVVHEAGGPFSFAGCPVKTMDGESCSPWPSDDRLQVSKSLMAMHACVAAGGLLDHARVVPGLELPGANAICA